MTTIRELIARLEAVENKDLDVVIDGDGYGTLIDVEVIDNVNRYYGKAEGGAWVNCTRNCVVLKGYE